MKSCLVIVALFAILCGQSTASDLRAGQVLRLEFPGLPDTLASLHSGQRQPAVLTAILPEDYRADREFPLFVFLGGGDGGRGTNVLAARRIIGDRGWIAVNLPLFKKSLDRAEPARGLMVSMEDFAVIQQAFQVMLEKLMAAVPNIRAAGSVLGGFSNGAHTTGVLLAGQDPFVLRRFDQFFLMEGGMGPLLANVLHKPVFRSKRILALHGDQPGRDGGSPPFGAVADALGETGRRYQLDLEVVAMRGYGHEQPPEYLRRVGEWALEGGAGKT